jgi:predicted RNA binding protein YcfA (HicA-like mRNA interferase family)
MKACEVNRRIESFGGEMLRQRGSHRFYQVEVEGVVARTTVPQHSGDIPVGLLSKIQRDLSPALGQGWLK